MLIGEYKAKLQEKNRVALPKKFRDEFEGNLIITRGYEGCLIVIDSNRWKELIRLVEIRPLTNQDVRNTKRFLVGGAAEIDFDKQGRFVLPDTLVEYAHLENELMFVGVENWLEVWDLEEWNAKIQQISESAADIADRLSSIENE